MRDLPHGSLGGTYRFQPFRFALKDLMLISRTPKNAKLLSIVERLWCVNDPSAGQNETILPSGKAQIIVSLSGETLPIDSPSGEVSDERSLQVFQGPTSRPRHVSRKPQVALCGVAFLAGGAGAIHDRIDKTVDRALDLGTVLGDADNSLQERLCQLGDDHARLDLLELEIVKRVRSTADVLRVRDSIRLLQDGLRIDDVCDALGCTPYLLRKLFLRNVGFTPKRFLRIDRFRDAVGRLTPEATLANVAAECSFADQAHMTREIGTIAQMTPGGLQSIDRQYPGHVPDD